jgi:molybdopterin molybdotransferase
MITVTEAEQIILAEKRDYGTETVTLEHGNGRVLAEALFSDRDFPPYDRITMDGIAIAYDAFEKGQKIFTVKGTQAAGDRPIEITTNEECVEVMTGAALPATVDTVVRYEDITIANGYATINIDNVRQGQNIHRKGSDKTEGTLLVREGQTITPALINTAASVGKSELLVKKLPKVIVLSNGDELVAVDEMPTPYQVRRSNSHAIEAILQQQGIVADMVHLPDDKTFIKNTLEHLLQKYDVIILSGGVSMGKYDYLPKVFEELHVEKKFHKVKQRPGKPFWFGTSGNSKVVFAFPGNPVSAFMCMHRYFIPWLHASLSIETKQPVYAVLQEDYIFNPELQYFLQVKIHSEADGRLMAVPAEGNGSGDFINLLDTDAFMELPEKQTDFKKGEAYRIWPYKQIVL